jgi:hypothetical protein
MADVMMAGLAWSTFVRILTVFDPLKNGCSKQLRLLNRSSRPQSHQLRVIV